MLSILTVLQVSSEQKVLNSVTAKFTFHCSAPHGIEVTGLAVVKQVMSSSPAYHQGLVHEGDIIATVYILSLCWLCTCNKNGGF